MPRAPRIVLVAVLVSVLGGACVPASNPFDPDAPPSLRATGRVVGRALDPFGRAVADVRISVVDATGVEVAGDVPALVEAGRFAFDVPAATYTVRAEKPPLLPATSGTLDVPPGGELDVGTL